jgi:parvulin-like peptidyl-prolyl isomerase
MSDDATANPYFTLSREELLKRVDSAQATIAQSQGAAGTTQVTQYDPAVIAQVLSNEVYGAWLRRQMEVHKAVPNDVDKAQAKLDLQQSQQGATPSQDENDSMVNQAALRRVLATEAFSAGEHDRDALEHQTYDQNKAQLVNPGQICLHAILIGPATAGAANASPSEADIAAFLAQANAAKARLATETFDAVADSVSSLKGNPDYPGGDVGCSPTTPTAQGALPASIINATASLAPGAVSEPVKLDQGYIIVRLDSAKAETPISFDEVKPRLDNYVANQIGKTKIADLQKQNLGATKITVDPRYGSWDATRLEVVAPGGAATTTSPAAPGTAPPTSAAPDLVAPDPTTGG